MIKHYFDTISSLLKTIEEQESERLKIAAEKVADCLKHDGIVQLFGCGHSHILTEEVFYRAGGLVPIKPILIEPLMLHEGAIRSSELEKQNGYADTFLQDQHFEPGDVVFVLSTSGRNPVAIDVAIYAKEKGAYVIGITSMAYSTSEPSRHTNGKHLYEGVDLVIDNHAPKGDAALTHPGVSVPFAPTSTVTGATILNSIFAASIAMFAESGQEPPVFLSGNIEGGKEHNESLIQKYQDRLPLLK
ncbi:SIS domain-containing protein [Camelliibacillus cellulosilyticus]|uniref:UPF0309 protein ACFO4N_10095 n=1 Tax=Camelliibacillus cellulosilyticus TaxID=2174486 RepID=A0ABV9GMB5_9BACL